MTQTDLFGKKNNILVLAEPPEETWKAIRITLENHCTKQEIIKFAEVFKPLLSKYTRIMKTTASGKMVNAKEVVDMTKSNLSKTVIAHSVALFFASEQNMQLYIDSLSEGMRSLWRMVLFNKFVSHSQAQQLLNTTDKLFSELRSSYYYGTYGYTFNKKEFGFFSINKFYARDSENFSIRDYYGFITVPNTIAAIFFPYFYPDASDTDTALDSLPEGKWRIVNFEADSQSHFLLFSGLEHQGAFTMKKKGVGTADMKKAQKKLALPEFFPGDRHPLRENLRAFSYIQLLVLTHLLPESQKLPYHKLMRSLITNFSRLDYYLPTLLYPHIKGLRQQMTDNGYHSRLCQMMFNWIKENDDKWNSIRDIYLKILVVDIGNSTTRPTTLVYHPLDEQYSTDMTNEYTSRTVGPERYSNEFGYTGLQMCALLLASLGMAEIAFNEEEPRNISPVDGIDFIRLTPLGQYAFGLTKKYDAPEQENTAYFELDPDRLIIRSLVEPNPYAQLLMDTSTPISRNRFETSALSFLASCHQREDVVAKINIFRQFISNDLPPLWEQFFQQLLLHCHPLTEDKASYKHYTIDPGNRELIELITTDPAIGELVIKAEGYRIMVRNDDIRKLELQLKKHGYLL